MAVFRVEKNRGYGARETGDFLLVNSTRLERHYGGDRIKHSHTPPTMREKP